MVKLTKFIPMRYMYLTKDLFTVKCQCNTHISKDLFGSHLISLGRPEAPWSKKFRSTELEVWAFVCKELQATLMKDTVQEEGFPLSPCLSFPLLAGKRLSAVQPPLLVSS